MAQSSIYQAMKQITEEKNISMEAVVETIEAALAVAYRKDFGEKNQNIHVEFDAETAQARVFDIKAVVDDEKVKRYEKLMAEREKRREKEQAEEKEGKEEKEVKKKEEIKKGKDQSSEEGEDEKEDRFDPKKEVGLAEAKKMKKGSKVGDEIKTELFPPAAYGRMAAQTAKQVIIQRLREAERETIYTEFKDKEGQLINGTVQRIEGKMVIIDLGRTAALLPPPEQIPNERYRPGQRMKFFVVAVNKTPKGPEIIISRSHAEMVRKLFTIEVPEINNGSVEIKSVAREAGARSKVAVVAHQSNIDPVGSCVGQRGSRVQTIITELGGEKIDIIEWADDSEIFISNALSPAKVLSVKTNEAEKTALAEVKEDQLSLAIGKAGQNVRLSAKLTGWKIDIVGEGGTKPAAQKPKEEPAKEDKESTDEKDLKESSASPESTKLTADPAQPGDSLRSETSQSGLKPLGSKTVSETETDKENNKPEKEEKSAEGGSASGGKEVKENKAVIKEKEDKEPKTKKTKAASDEDKSEKSSEDAK
ncbi:transcription termination factor NusA [Patescibacteria group bacterium]